MKNKMLNLTKSALAVLIVFAASLSISTLASAGPRAYRAYNNLYLSVQDSSSTGLKTVVADSQRIGPSQSFENPIIGGDQAQLKTSDGFYLSVIDFNSGLMGAIQTSTPGPNETFRLVSLDPFYTTWAFAAANGKYLRITAQPDGKWVLEATATSTSIKQAQFKRIWLNGEPVAIRHQYPEKYLRAYDDGTLKFDSNRIGADETFYRVNLLDGTFAYRSKKNGLYFSAEDGLGLVTASKDHIDDWELFDHFQTTAKNDYLHTYYGMLLGTASKTSDLLSGVGKTKDLTTMLKVVELNGRRVALKTQSGNYVTLDAEAQQPLKAETIQIPSEAVMNLVDLGYLDSLAANAVAIKLSNGKYLTALNGGGTSVGTTATAVDSWEIFKVVSKPNGVLSFRTSDKKHYLQAASGGGSSVNVTGTQSGQWESFEVVDLEGKKVILQNSNTLKDNRCVRTIGLADEASLAMNPEVGGNQAGIWCSFDYIEIPYIQPDGSKVVKGVFRNTEGNYLTASNGGGEAFEINSDHINVWELFTLNDWGSANSPVRTVSISTLDQHFWRIVYPADSTQVSEVTAQTKLIQNGTSFLMRQFLRPNYIQLMKP